MFKKLRNRFLLLTMSIISIVMIAAFSVIYLTTYKNIQSNSQEKMKNISISGIQITTQNNEDASLEIATGEEDKRTVSYNVFINPELARQDEWNGAFLVVSPDYSLSFSIEADKDGNILNVHSLIDMPKEYYEKITKQAWDKNSDNSVVNFKNKVWQYSITPINVGIYTGDGQVFLHSNEEKYNMAFLDVTESYKTLHDLLITFLAVGLIMLAVIFVICLYFSNRAIEPIAETWQKQKQFITDASHELKTPITIIKSNYGVLMENRKETIESQMEWLDYIKIGADRMSRLTNDLLTLANMDNDNLADRNEDFNVSNAAQDVVQSMRARTLGKSIRLSTEIEQNIFVNSNVEKLMRVFIILLDNAIKYTNENGWIDVSLAATKRHMVCTVKNSGNGIAKEDLSKAFDRFFRTDPSRANDTEGYGLGLSIAKAIMDKLGGKITVESIENESTTFTVTLGL